MAELIGKTLAGRYRIEEKLGSGGMSEVYKVWDTKRSTPLAIKLLHDYLALDPVFIRRFRREAETLATLQHPHIVRFYGLEEDDLLAFIVMDFIDGSTLQHVIRRLKGQPMEPERILEIFRPVCSALSYAHHEGFVHCDIKPGNIMIHKNGTVYLADFGISRMASSATVTMATAGTPAYMAPEQIQGRKPTPETDIYALGSMLYEMVTGGEQPFTGERAKIDGSTGERVNWEREHLDPIAPSAYRSDLPVALEALILRCLQKNPDNRYRSALEYFEALQCVLQPQPEPVFEVEPDQKTEGDVRTLPFSGTTILEQPVPQTATSTDTKTELAEEETSAVEPYPTSNSPISNRIGKRTWIAGLVSLAVIGLIIGAIFLLSHLRPYQYQAASSIHFSSAFIDLSRGLYLTSNRSGRAEIYRFTADGSRVSPVTNTTVGTSKGPVFAPDGSLYFTSTRDGKPEIYRFTQDGKNVAWVTNTPGNGGSWGPVFAPDGRMYFTSDRDGKKAIYAFDIDGKSIAPVTSVNSPGESWGPAFNPSGTLYFTSTRDGWREIYRFDQDGKTILRVTQTPNQAESWDPAFAPNGTLYFTSNRDGKREIYRFEEDGKTISRVTQTPSNWESWGPSFTLDGQLYFTSNRSGKMEIYRFSPDGKSIIQVTNSPGQGQSWIVEP